MVEKIDIKLLRNVCHILNIEKKGIKDEVVQRILQFLLNPTGDDEPEKVEEEAEEEEEEEEEEPPRGKKRKDNRNDKKSSGGRPRRSTAGRGYNRDYTSSEESEEEYTGPKGKRKRNQSDSGSDVCIFH